MEAMERSRSSSDYVAGTAARDEADGAEDEEQSQDHGVEVVMSRGGVVEEVHIEDADGQDGDELRPEHPFLKGKARHGDVLRVKDI